MNNVERLMASDEFKGMKPGEQVMARKAALALDREGSNVTQLRPTVQLNPIDAAFEEGERMAAAGRAEGWKTFAGAKILIGDVQKDDGATATKYAGKIRLAKFTHAQKDVLLKSLSERSGVSLRALAKDAADAEEKANDDKPPAPKKKDGWPDGYVIHDKHLCFERHDGDKTYYEKLCAALDIVGTARDEHSGQWALVLKFNNRVGRPQEVNLTFANILSDPGKTIAALANAGLKIDGDKDRKARLFTCLSRVETSEHIMTVNQPGTYEGAVVTPIGKVVNGDADKLRLRNHRTALTVKDRSQKGSLDQWKLTVAEALGLIDFHGPVIMATGFAGTLVELLGIDTIALIFFGGSSSGKSFMQKLAATIDANPASKMGLFHTGNMRVAGLERALASASGACLHLDDLLKNMPDPKLLPQLPFLLQGGVGNTRGTADGGEQDTKHWRCTATATMEEKYATAMQRAVKDSYVSGQDVRMIPISLSGAKVQTTKEGRSTIKRLEQQMAKNYGWARELFVKTVMDIGDDRILEMIEEEADKILALGADDNLRARAAYALAVCVVAGRIAQQINLLPEETNLDAAFKRAWLASIGNPDEIIGNTPEGGLERLRERSTTSWAAHARDVDTLAQVDTPGLSRADTWFVFGDALSLRGQPYRCVGRDAFSAMVAPADPDAVLALILAQGKLIRTANQKNIWYSIGQTAWPHYKVAEDFIGPQADSWHDDDEAEGDAGGTKSAKEQAKEYANVIKSYRSKPEVPGLPPESASEVIWKAYLAMLLIYKKELDSKIDAVLKS
jgi:hypothetical protein